jgi:hypothetical protein
MISQLYVIVHKFVQDCKNAILNTSKAVGIAGEADAQVKINAV